MSAHDFSACENGDHDLALDSYGVWCSRCPRRWLMVGGNTIQYATALHVANERIAELENLLKENTDVVKDLIYRLRKRAEIRRSITTRKSVQEGKPDRISDILEEAANALEKKYEIK